MAQIKGVFDYLEGSGMFGPHTPYGKKSDGNMWAVERNQRSWKNIYPWSTSMQNFKILVWKMTDLGLF